MSTETTIIDSREAWPFPAITEARKPGAWVEISEEHADQLLGGVPPIYIPGGFMVGEPATHHADGCPVYCAVINVGGRYLARELRYDERKQAAAMARTAVLTQAAGL